MTLTLVHISAIIQESKYPRHANLNALYKEEEKEEEKEERGGAAEKEVQTLRRVMITVTVAGHG